jgi:2-dehydropantoate 2-reductase
MPPSPTPSRIVVSGAGGVGGLLGARLVRAGARVGFVVRSERVAALRASGLRVTTLHDSWTLDRPEVTADASELGRADVLFLATKAQDLAAAAAACRPVVGEGTLVVTLQNGVDAEEIARRGLPGASVLPGVVYVAAVRMTTGEIGQTSDFFKIVFGATSGATPAGAKRIVDACLAAGVEATIAADMPVRLWTKFLFIASVAAVTASRNLRIGALRADAAAMAELTAAMREGEAVARASGIPLAADVVDRSLAFFASLPPDVTSSLHEDLLAGRPLEVEFLSGALVRRARERGIPTPVHSAAYERLRR